MTDAASPLSFTRGPAMANRIMLAPLTNLQSRVDGVLSDDEIKWLTMRAQGGMGLVMTAAAHVQRQGQGFPGQLGIWSDDHIPRLMPKPARARSPPRRSSSCVTISSPRRSGPKRPGSMGSRFTVRMAISLPSSSMPRTTSAPMAMVAASRTASASSWR